MDKAVLQYKRNATLCKACVRAAHLSGAVVAHANVARLAGLDGIRHCIHQVFDLDPATRRVDLIQVDLFAFQPFKAARQSAANAPFRETPHSEVRTALCGKGAYFVAM